MVSLAALRAVRTAELGVEAPGDPARDLAARELLALLALSMLEAQVELGWDLRSGCQLVPQGEPAVELVGRLGAPIASAPLHGLGAAQALRARTQRAAEMAWAGACRQSSLWRPSRSWSCCAAASALPLLSGARDSRSCSRCAASCCWAATRRRTPLAALRRRSGHHIPTGCTRRWSEPPARPGESAPPPRISTCCGGWRGRGRRASPAPRRCRTGHRQPSGYRPTRRAVPSGTGT